MKFNKVIFRDYDVRGKYNIDYDDSFAFHLGKAFVNFCREKYPNEKIVISLGKDARHSSTPLVKSLSEGIRSEGGDVYNLGLVTSPVTYFSCFHIKNLTGAIVVTGSHNPPEYNGFKISLKDTTLTAGEIQELLTYVEKAITASSDQKKGTESDYDIITPYVKRISEEFNLSKASFAVDCGNGAAGSVARKVYEACELDPIILFEKPDGDFPNHHPDPTLEENLVSLKSCIKENNLDFGIGYDGDADRIVAVSKSGKTLYADELMSIYAKDILSSYPGAEIVADVKCSEEYFKLLSKWGAKPVMWKTGHSLIKKKVKDLNTPFGGEFSGHIFFNDRFYGFDDAIYCSLRLIEIIQKTSKSLDELLVEFPKTFSSPEIRLEVGEEEKYKLVEKYKNEIKEFSSDINDIDGVRVNFDNGWALVRVSNTQPCITLRFESTSKEGLDKIKDQAYEILGL